MAGFLDGIGALVEKVCNYIPGREESIRNRIDKIKREMDEITKQPNSTDSIIKFSRLAAKLRVEESKLQNR